MTHFRDRQAAGRALAASLVPYGADTLDLLVLALPRGGVPVASEVAQVLGAPLDVFLVRKLGAPGREELALGALASGGVRVMNDELVRSLRVTEPEISAVAVREEEELLRRERLYRGARPFPQPFLGVGRWYARFPQTSDEEVQRLLGRTLREVTRP